MGGSAQLLEDGSDGVRTLGWQVLGANIFFLPLCFCTAEVEQRRSMSWDSIPEAGALGSADISPFQLQSRDAP